MYEKTQQQRAQGSRPSSSTPGRPTSASYKTHCYKHVSSASNVDETLFASPDMLQGSNFAAPWEKKGKTKRPLLWSPAPSTTPRGPSSPIKREYHKIKFKASYCDDTLFGPKLMGADWAAPWEKKEKKKRPLVFDTTFTNTRTQALNPGTPRDGAESHRPTSSRPGSRSKSTTTPLPPWK